MLSMVGFTRCGAVRAISLARRARSSAEERGHAERVRWFLMPPARVPDEDAVRFGAIVTRLRMERRWTLADLAQVTGLNATWLGVLERGGNTPSLTTVFKLARVFGVEAAELVREVEQ